MVVCWNQQMIQGFIADSYIDIQTARLMISIVLVMDSEGDPRVDISAIKIYVPAAMHKSLIVQFKFMVGKVCLLIYLYLECIKVQEL